MGFLCNHDLNLELLKYSSEIFVLATAPQIHKIHSKIHFYYTLDSHILQSGLLFLVQQQQQKIKIAKPKGEK